MRKNSFHLIWLVFALWLTGGFLFAEEDGPRLFFYNEGDVAKKADEKPTPKTESAPQKPSTPSAKTAKEAREDERTSEKSPTPQKKKKKLSQADIEAEISRNEEETLRRYRQILESERYEVKQLRKRIRINEKLVKKYEKRLALTKRELERVRIDLTTRALLLKKSKEDGRISEAEFQKRLKRVTEQLNMESRELKADLEFYQKELTRLKSILSRLKDELRVKEEARKVAMSYEKKHKGSKNPLGSEFERIYRQFRALLPKKLKPVFENNPLRSPYLRPKKE